jgi:hypothetical protein
LEGGTFPLPPWGPGGYKDKVAHFTDFTLIIFDLAQRLFYPT